MKDKVVKEFNSIGNYRVRVIENKKGAFMLDVREYIESDTFTGFTRKGVRFELARVIELDNALVDVIALMEGV